jgi:hypothetical protein
VEILVPVFGMVKDDRHRTRAIASDQGEITISAHRGAFKLLTDIQKRSARYSVAYARSSTRRRRSPWRCARFPASALPVVRRCSALLNDGGDASATVEQLPPFRHDEKDGTGSFGFFSARHAGKCC